MAGEARKGVGLRGESEYTEPARVRRRAGKVATSSHEAANSVAAGRDVLSTGTAGHTAAAGLSAFSAPLNPGNTLAELAEPRGNAQGCSRRLLQVIFGRLQVDLTCRRAAGVWCCRCRACVYRV